MKHVGVKVFVAVVIIVGLFNALSSLSSGRSSKSSTRRSGYSYSSSGKSSSAYTPKTTSAPTQTTAKPSSTKPFPSEGQRVGAIQYNGMKRQYRDTKTCWCPTTLYLYTVREYTYKLWISDDDTIIKVELYSVAQQPGKTSSGSSGKKPASPEFDIDAFSNPENFYDWYMDDFIDFEEAEEYYYDHGGD